MQQIEIMPFYEKDGKLLRAIAFDDAAKAVGKSRRWLHKHAKYNNTPQLYKGTGVNSRSSYFDAGEFEAWKLTEAWKPINKRGK